MLAKFNFDKKDLLSILLAFAATGGAYAVNHQATVITWTVMVIVWLLNSFAKRKGLYVGRTWLTGIIYGFAVALAVIFQPVTWPAFPVFAGDATAFVDLFILYVAQISAIGAGIYAAATALYNVLMKRILDKSMSRMCY